MRYVWLLGLTVIASSAWSQNDPLIAQFGKDPNAVEQQATGGNLATETRPVPNPFKQPAPAGGGMGMGMEMGYGGEMSGFGGMEEAMMGMEMYSEQETPNHQFRRGLQRAIRALKNAKSAPESDALRGYVRDAFAERYDKMIADRKRDIEKLKKNISKLEQDLDRREAAKDRVVQLQLQSVQLAAEGLLDLSELQGVAAGGQSPGYGEGGYGAMEYDYGGDVRR